MSIDILNETRFICVARAIIVNDNGEVLVGRRNKKDRNSPDLFCIVGGKKERHEKIADTVDREVTEETGRRVLSKRILHITLEETEQISWKTYYFEVHTVENLDFELTPEDGDSFEELRWISAKDISSINLAYDHKDILEQYFNKKLREQ